MLTGGLWEAAGCHQQKAKSETMLGLCASVWAQCEGAREVRKGKADSVFTQSWKRLHSTGLLHLQEKGGQKEEWLVKRRHAWLVYWHAPKRLREGPLYWTVNKWKVLWIIGWLKKSLDNKKELWIQFHCKIQRQQIIHTWCSGNAIFKNGLVTKRCWIIQDIKCFIAFSLFLNCVGQILATITGFYSAF